MALSDSNVVGLYGNRDLKVEGISLTRSFNFYPGMLKNNMGATENVVEDKDTLHWTKIVLLRGFKWAGVRAE